MKKVSIFLIIFLLTLISCNHPVKAKKLFNQAVEIMVPSNLGEWKIGPTEEKTKTLELLDEAIKLDPKWWNPYNQKIQIYKIGGYEENADKVKEVYDLWLSNGNSLKEFSQFSYACSLYCTGNEDQAMEQFSKFYSKYSRTSLKEEKKMIFIFSGIFLRQIDESNLRSIASERVDESIVQFLEGFIEEFKNDPKGAVWKYV
jgi:tetratricopeptide (TPR) repeat protein